MLPTPNSSEMSGPSEPSEPTEPTGRSVLVAGIVDETYTTSVNFATMMIRLQQRLAVGGDSVRPVQFEFFISVKHAIDHFKKTTASRLVVLDATMSIDPEFILCPHEHDIVVPVYPMRTLDWTRVANHVLDGGATAASARASGMSYNFSMPAQSDLIDGRYLQCDASQIRIFSISRDAVDTFIASYNTETSSFDGPVMLDIKYSVTTSGAYDFAGCVGNRFTASSS
jgi:hypothetical protein